MIVIGRKRNFFNAVKLFPIMKNFHKFISFRKVQSEKTLANCVLFLLRAFTLIGS